MNARAPLRALLLLALGAAAVPALAQGPVAGIEPGLWQLKAAGEPTRNMCVPNAGALIQVRHDASPCSRLTIAADGKSTTVHYSCPGAGWGRTTLKVTTPRAVRIDTQGIAANEPFAFSGEARRVGDCGARTAAR